VSFRQLELQGGNTIS